MRLAKAWFDQVVDHVGQTKDQVGQGQGQELDKNTKVLQINVIIISLCDDWEIQ